MAEECSTCNKESLTWRVCIGRVTESDNSEKLEKNFKKTGERKKETKSETRKESGKYVADVCRTCKNVSIACVKDS